MIDYSKLHWYSDNEDFSVYSIIDFPDILVYIKDDKIIEVSMLNE